MSTDASRKRKKAKNLRSNARYNNARHRTLRAYFDQFVQAGLAICARCGAPIEPGAWDLGHDDLDPTQYSGPEHTWCNRGAPHRNKTSREW